MAAVQRSLRVPAPRCVERSVSYARERRGGSKARIKASSLRGTHSLAKYDGEFFDTKFVCTLFRRRQRDSVRCEPFGSADEVVEAGREGRERATEIATNSRAIIHLLVVRERRPDDLLHLALRIIIRESRMGWVRRGGMRRGRARARTAAVERTDEAHARTPNPPCERRCTV